jgi:hypothetical protein
MIPNKTNPDLFLLLLQNDVKQYLNNKIKIPQKLLNIGLDTIDIDFYIGSGGNIALDEICIYAKNKNTSAVLFTIYRNGEYHNLSLYENDLNFILSLTTIMKFDDGQLPEYYDLFSLPITIDKNYYEKMLEKAIENENYELANEIMNKIKNDKWD